MKKFLTVLILLGILVITYVFRVEIVDIILEKVIIEESISQAKFDYKNDYYINYEFDYVENIDDPSVKNRNDLLNLYYTIINSGNANFSFYCPKEYTSCIEDVIYLANSQKDLSNINGFVHPFNSFDTIETSYNSLGQVSLKIVKTYTDVEINDISQKMHEILANQIKDETDTKKIIKILHDYIIETTKYDKERTDNNIIKYASNTAYGVLFEGYGICSGYADAMAIFLNYYNIPNYKVVSENHVWNAVYIDNEWYHLDLTWDDPIVSTGEEVLEHTYFLITTDQLENLNDAQHIFDKKVFSEL